MSWNSIRFKGWMQHWGLYALFYDKVALWVILENGGGQRKTLAWYMETKGLHVWCAKNSPIMLVGEQHRLLWCSQSLWQVFFFFFKVWLQFRTRWHVCFLVLCLFSDKKWQDAHLCSTWKWKSPPTAPALPISIFHVLLKSPYLKWSICYCCQRWKAMWVKYIWRGSA